MHGEEAAPARSDEPGGESRRSQGDSTSPASTEAAGQPAAGGGTSTPRSWKERLSFLAAVLGIPVAVLAIVGGVLSLPKQVEEARQAVTDPDGVAPRILEGEIREAATNEPLSGVEVVLPRYGKRQTTDELGRYRFELEVPRYARVTLRASREGYRPLEVDPMVGGGDTWTMRRLE